MNGDQTSPLLLVTHIFSGNRIEENKHELTKGKKFKDNKAKCYRIDFVTKAKNQKIYIIYYSKNIEEPHFMSFNPISLEEEYIPIESYIMYKSILTILAFKLYIIFFLSDGETWIYHTLDLYWEKIEDHPMKGVYI